MTQSMIRKPVLSGLPRTGQTTTAPTAEYQAGDDGTYQAGHPSTSRFIDVGNGVVRDTLYTPELMWPKTPHLMIPGPVGVAAENTIQAARGTWSNAVDYVAGDVVQGDGAPDALFYVCILANGVSDTPQEPPNATYWVVTPWIGSAANLTTGGTMNWSAAVTNCEALSYAGYTDWRLPNTNELISLYNADDATNPSIHSPFSILTGLTFMASTTQKAATTWEQTVSFSTYLIVSRTTKVSALSAMPVRGGKKNG